VLFRQGFLLFCEDVGYTLIYLSPFWLKFAFMPLKIVETPVSLELAEIRFTAGPFHEKSLLLFLGEVTLEFELAFLI
jgi:hypothetical protein